MPDVMPSQLMNSVMAKLYDVLTNGDDTVPASEDNFFSWATPGIPVEEADFDFLSQGLTGVVKQAAIVESTPPPPPSTGNPPPPPTLSPAQLEALRAQDTAQLYMQAENFARLVDFVPDVASVANGTARLSVMNNEGSLSDIYSYVLRMSQVAETELDEATKKKIAEYRALLSVTTTKKNLIDGTETEVSGPSPLTQIYFEKMSAYEDAALLYNSHRIDALTGQDSRAVQDFALNANILRNKVKAAMSDWVSSGYKNDYEAISAYIDEVMRRDMTLLKEEYRDDLEKARLTGLASGSDFFFSSLVPGNFAKSSGWTEFRFGSANYQSDASSNYSTKSWEASASGGFLGLFSAGGGGGSTESRSEYNSNFSSDYFSLGFKMAQVPIVRPWLKPAFLLSKSWRFDQGNQEAKGQMVSDGAKPPKGLAAAYPTSIIFVRELKLDFGESSGFQSFMAQSESSHAEAGGGFSWGPFSLGGSYSHSEASGSTDRKQGYHWDGQSMEIDGMQIVGFKCHILPKSPDPLSTITEWV